MKKLILLALLFCLAFRFPPDSDIPDWMLQYREDYQLLDRFYNIHGTPEYTKRMLELTQSYLQKLEQLNYEKLNLDAKIDYQLFRRSLQEEAENISSEAAQIEAAKKLYPFASEMYEMVKLQRRGQQPDAEAVAARTHALNKAVVAALQELQTGDTLDARVARPAARHLAQVQKAFDQFYHFYNDYDPTFSWWMQQPYKELSASMKQYIELLGSKNQVQSTQRRDRSGIVGTPIGEAEIRRKLRYEMIPYSPDELIRIAEKEFAWCDREMLKASRELGYGDDWRKALEHVKETRVEPGKQPELILRLYNESVAFIRERDLITIPPLCEETWRMSMMSAEQQRVNPFFLGGEEIIISYPVSEMNHEEKLMSMRGNNGHFSRATVQHELIPGHGLQMFMNARYKSHRSTWNGFWGEGWALYWERLLWDQGFPQSPEDKIGMLFWRMHRCGRIIFSLKYHLGEWTPQECIDFLTDRVGHERANAEGEVRRSFTGGYDPLYQLAYMIGGLQFESLCKTLVDSGRMSYRDFHDRILQENQMPVELVRAILLQEAPEKDFISKWRFYPEK